MFKKTLALFLVVVFCVVITNSTVSAKLSQPTNTIKTNGNGGKTDIGMWFITYNNYLEFGNNFGSGYPIKYRMLMPDGSFGILDSSNVEHIDFQLKELAEAKVDFILFDLTNGGLTKKVEYGWDEDANGNLDDYMVKNAMLTCQRISKWNNENDWKIRYAVAVGTYPSITRGKISSAEAAEYQAEAVYKLFYENKTYGKDHYTMDGKPLIVLFDWNKSSIAELNKYKGDKTYCQKFTVRDAIQGEKGTYGWQAWKEREKIVDDEVILISPGHDNSAGSETVSISREDGKFYQRCWETILTNTLPRIVMISSFNDYHEQTAVFTADSSKCRDGYEAKWIDETGKINNSMYWDMTKDGIRLIRGTNGEIDTEMKSVWFDLSEGKITSQNNDKSQEDKNTSKPTQNNENKIAKSNSNKTVIVIVSVVMIVIVVFAGAITFFVLFKKKKQGVK